QAIGDPDSIFYYYQQLIRLRKAHSAIVYGAYALLLEEHPQIYAFTRTLDKERLLVILNFSQETPIFELPAELLGATGELLIGNYPVEPGQAIEQITLRPYEARVYRVA
ncbi:MAG TPA: alpha-glucosidase C-terminal domain-containing protein, partial [Roseiflexaceae bacterium]|nr:alpha-glucosidase C-terminal domain-containing protein [Roseiflexaceae bacterium]